MLYGIQGLVCEFYRYSRLACSGTFDRGIVLSDAYLYSFEGGVAVK